MNPPVILTGFGDTVILNVPVFGDTISNEHVRINRQTRGGQLIVYRDSQWPVMEKLKYKFEDLKDFQIKNLLLFMEKWLGRTITISDHNGVRWSGIITTPNAEAVQDKPNWLGCGGFTIEFEFEGKKL